MKQILEKLELTEEKTVELQEAFDSAVLVEATKLAESKEEDYEEYLLAQVEEMKAELEDNLDAYLEKVVEQFVEENTFAMDEAVKTEKYEAVLEGFNSLMIATGVEIAQIAESKEIKDEEIMGEAAEIDQTNAELADTLMAENLSLKAKNDELLKTGLIKESMEDMTVMQKDKFLKLASVVEFNGKNPVDFINKMDTLVESVKGEITQKPEVNENIINESVEKSTSKYVSAASHLY